MGASAPVSVPDPAAQSLAQAEREHAGEEVLEDTGVIPETTEDESHSDTSEPSESDSNGSLFDDDDEGMDSCDAE
jgi:ribosomal protein L12E/L44/L45/RPP1/RPP2